MSERDERKVLSKVPHIYRSQYIQLPEHSDVAIADHQLHYGKQWYDERQKTMGTHYFLALSGLQMPTIREFMTYRENVSEARVDKRSLQDLNGGLYEGERLNVLDDRLTSNCRTWLNARFVQGSGFQRMDLERVVGVYEDGTLETRREPLLPCVWEDCYVRLDSHNSQGLPQEIARKEGYIEKSIYFYHPWLNSVARFFANSDGAVLNCRRNPAGSNSGLGVFACANFQSASYGDRAGERLQKYQIGQANKVFVPQANDIMIDETSIVSALTPESYKKKAAIVEALEGREDLSDREVEEIRRILRKEQK